MKENNTISFCWMFFLKETWRIGVPVKTWFSTPTLHLSIARY